LWSSSWSSNGLRINRLDFSAENNLNFLECEGTLKSLLNIIRQPVTKESCLSVKAALLALGHFIGSISEGYLLIT
jgi:hypothetical protein